MDLLHPLALGFGVACTPANLACALTGCLLGLLAGVLPGLSLPAAIALLLPAAYALPPAAGLILLAGVCCGAQYGGAIAAMLVHRPQAPVTAIDGQLMTRRGLAGPALATANIGAFVAGCCGTLVLAACAAPLAGVAAALEPPEYFSLMALVLAAAVVLSAGSLLKAIGMSVLGLLLGLVGADAHSGMTRFSFGLPPLADGVGLAALAVGVCLYGPIIAHLARREEPRDVLTSKVAHLYPARDDVRLMGPAILRGTLLGALLGALPGGGALLSAFAAHALEQKTRLRPGEAAFGKGNLRGVAAPAAAHGAGAQTAFLPLLALGIAPNAVLALLAGALAIHHLAPGPQLLAGTPDLFWGLIASLWIASLALAVLNLPLARLWIRLLALPYRWLFPVIALLGAIGMYSINHAAADVWLAGVFGAVGYVFIKLDMPPAPLLLGFVLGPMMEEQLRRALLVSRGDWGVLLARPLSVTLLGLTALLLVGALLPAVRKRRDEVFAED